MKPAREIIFSKEEVRAIRLHKGRRPSPAFIAAKVRSIRTRLGMSQAEFAAMLRISKPTVQNWEQARRVPEGPALALLLLADKVPDVVSEVLARTA
ncbi:MAG TPA: helix-turn-helix domain-containing protein [Planctomycetota bacterium]|jgi:putative transcriptional regulator